RPTHGLLEVTDAGLHLLLQPLRPVPAVRAHVVAGLGGDREAGRDGEPDPAHLGEVGAFAAEERLHRAVAFGGAVAEAVDVLGHAGWGIVGNAPRLYRRPPPTPSRKHPVPLPGLPRH